MQKIGVKNAKIGAKNAKIDVKKQNGTPYSPDLENHRHN